MAVTPSVSVGDVVAREVNGVQVAAGFPVSLSRPAVVPVTVAYTTRDGDALSAADFSATAGSLTFLPGETMRTVPVPVTDDGVGENAERFSLVLSDPLGASLGRAVGAGTIVDDDALPVRRVPRVTMVLSPTLTGSTLVRGRVLPPFGALPTSCSFAKLKVTASRHQLTVVKRTVTLDANCAYRVRLKQQARKVRVVARFLGSDALRPVNGPAVDLKPAA